jgi:hypothetical protein
MTGAELIEYTRELLRDNAKPPLWSDPVILRYINEGEREFCSRTHILTTYDTTIDVDDTASVYPLPDKVMMVMGVGTDEPLQRLNANTMPLVYATESGPPKAFATDLGHRLLSIYPKPDAAYTLTLVVAMRPSEDVTETSEPSIPSEYHYNLCDYAAYKCTATNDVDTEAPNASMKLHERWLTAVRDAKRHVYHYRLPPRLAMNNWTGGK